MDIWRISPAGGEPERITFHASRVSYPVFLDRTTLLYLATAEDGSGPWLHGMDLERRTAHRIGPGLEQYTSLGASADGRRLAATVATSRTSLWRVPVRDRMATEADAKRIPLPATGGRWPRLGRGYLLFVPGDGSGIRRLTTAGNRSTELWNGRQDRLAAGPAIDPATQRIAFSVAEAGRTRLKVMNADGTGLRTLAASLQVKGAPAWSPDGRSIVVAADQGKDTRLFKVPVDGTPVVPFAADYSRDAAWSPDGRLLVFNGADVGPTFSVEAMSADGRSVALPDIVLPRGARRLVFLPGGDALVVLKGAAHDRNFWLVDLRTGSERQLTAFDPGFAIGDFDVSADGREIVFDQLRQEPDVVRIDLAQR
jgi:Tol biopolymer transport system component